MGASEIVLNGVFYVLAIAAVASAVAVATSRNIVRSAFALLAVLFAAAALYAVMKADFIAAAQVLIYVGGILVLIIFAVMLTHRITDVKLSNDSTPGPAAFCACLCLLFSLVVVVLFTAKWQREPVEVRTIQEGMETLLSQFQADGRTEIARGGSSTEDTVVLSVRVPQPVLHIDQVEFQAVSGKEIRKQSVPYVGGQPTVHAFESLPEGDWHWSALLRGTRGDGSPWEGVLAPTPPGKPDFTVYRGITEPVARALAGDYLFAFEAVSVLLLAALVGAAFLARKEVKEA